MAIPCERLVIGYRAAEELTGIPRKRLTRLVERRAVRVVKLNKRTVAFYPSHLQEDIAEFETKKL